jgi:hypothetical protein
LSYSLGLEGEEEPEAVAPARTLSSLTLHHRHPANPQWVSAIQSSWTTRPHLPVPCLFYLTPARGRRHARRGHPSWVGQHRRPRVLSPRHSPPLCPSDQFHWTPSPPTQPIAFSVRAGPTRPSRPACPEQVSHSHAPAPLPVLHRTLPCTASHARHNTTLALSCGASRRPRRTLFCLQPI